MDRGYRYHADLIQRHIELVPGYAAIRDSLLPGLDIGEETLRAILGAAAEFAERRLVPVNRAGDLQGCRFQAGRVLTPDCYKQAWQELTSAGWNSVDQPTEFGGQGLPSFVNTACRELFDRACMAIGMLTGPTRAGTQLLLEFADPALQQEWIPQLVAGKWSLTICISEADAGSDVGRVRSQAVPDADGRWGVTGEKMWTSFGDNDLVERIGHLLLARTPGAPAGTAGLSLFLVPNKVRGQSGEWVGNGVSPRRIEEKLGLHGSPTCAMGFEGAKGHLLGRLHRGLPQMFVMIQSMRLMVATEGVGISFGAEQAALGYAAERRQGGNPSQPPVAINTHVDIQRQLLSMAARVEVLRGMLYELAVRIDVERQNVVVDERHARITQWLLPIAKASCPEAAFEVPSAAIQVLGGAGYTREWPCGQWLRDARMMSIAEGSTGIQALDLLHRRLWRDGGETLFAFVETATNEIGSASSEVAGPARRVIERLHRVGRRMLGWRESPREAETGAVAFLQLALLAATAWIAVRLATQVDGDRIGRRLAAAGRYWLSDIDARSAFHEQEALAGAARLAEFQQV
ncbi:acyl-CoA dehydrogenase family protein [Bradyrhizobium liaoningense]|uniref:acyl-CoA dehydrogenase family protein n=1 Tax=Bradyrhizobium liaoningense TaxID=43992 RepID=UPI001BA4523C|nr:acyl-CoA dehydrogenase family protein [Bradyrhizobium liaoningense]MBR0706965.1 acyl-CoA dehydrogenase family protein [Bradyrhizobium liaoningense]